METCTFVQISCSFKSLKRDLQLKSQQSRGGKNTPALLPGFKYIEGVKRRHLCALLPVLSMLSVVVVENSWQKNVNKAALIVTLIIASVGLALLGESIALPILERYINMMLLSAPSEMAEKFGSPAAVVAYNGGSVTLARPAEFGPVRGETAPARVIDTDACGISMPINNSPFIALVERGGCSFQQKVYNLQQAGATAVLVADNVQESYLIAMSADPCDDEASKYGLEIQIPSFFITREVYEGLKLIALPSENISINPLAGSVIDQIKVERAARCLLLLIVGLCGFLEAIFIMFESDSNDGACSQVSLDVKYSDEDEEDCKEKLAML